MPLTSPEIVDRLKNILKLESITPPTPRWPYYCVDVGSAEVANYIVRLLNKNFREAGLGIVASYHPSGEATGQNKTISTTSVFLSKKLLEGENAGRVLEILKGQSMMIGWLMDGTIEIPRMHKERQASLRDAKDRIGNGGNDSRER